MADHNSTIRKPTSTSTPHRTASSNINQGPAGQMPTRKLSAPVHRTTSETMRLGEPIDNTGKNQQYQHHHHHHHHNHGESLGSIPFGTFDPNSYNNPNLVQPLNQIQQQQQPQQRTKKTSFQITSVTVGNRNSNDAGEDSNDDLDESHTEDNNSRLTDIETPSYSEDTFSKDDVFFNTSNAALSTAPVIPTSSQYGLAIVPSSDTNNTNNSTNASDINTLEIASVTDNNIINLLSSNAKQDADLREVNSHGRNERFKVVKIESTEPFKRGRWTCMDYLDHTSVNQASAINTPRVSDPNEVCVSYGVTDADKQQVLDDKGVSVNTNGSIHHDVQQPLGATAASYSAPVSQQQQVPQQQYYQSSAQQPVQATTLPNNLQPSHANNMGHTQSMPQGSIPLMTQQGVPSSQASNNVVVQQQAQSLHLTNEDTTAYVPVNTQGQSMPQAQNVSCAPNSQSNILTSQHQASTSQQHMTDSLAAMQALQGLQNIHNVPQLQQQLQPQVMTTAGQIPTPQQQQQTATSATTGGTAMQIVGSVQQDNMPYLQQQPDKEQEAGMNIGTSSATPSENVLPDSGVEGSGSTEKIILEGVEGEGTSAANAVAIDNKIEQAMDLVKSHLMFAVREEVEVLKEKIAELMDRINQLEAENAVLKANASADVLAQLIQLAANRQQQQPTASQPTQSQPSQQPPQQQSQHQQPAQQTPHQQPPQPQASHQQQPQPQVTHQQAQQQTTLSQLQQQQPHPQSQQQSPHPQPQQQAPHQQPQQSHQSSQPSSLSQPQQQTSHQQTQQHPQSQQQTSHPQSQQQSSHQQSQQQTPHSQSQQSQHPQPQPSHQQPQQQQTPHQQLQQQPPQQSLQQQPPQQQSLHQQALQQQPSQQTLSQQPQPHQSSQSQPSPPQ